MDKSNVTPIPPGLIPGYMAGCPFCASFFIGIPPIGTPIRIISGYNAGAEGVVANWPEKFPRIDNEFVAQLNGDQEDLLNRVSTRRDKIQKLPISKIPDWAPPLCLRDADILDTSVVEFCEKSYSINGKWKINWQSFNWLIYTVWHYRLPLEPDELWMVLRAHGVPDKSKRSLIDFYKKGRNLLIYCHGRKAIKKKRVEPLSV